MRKIDWDNTNLRPKTRALLQTIAQSEQADFVEAIVLFGSEARGTANIASDIDIAVISTRPLTLREKLSVYGNVPQTLMCEVDARTVALRKTDLETEHVLNVAYSIQREGLVIYENVS